MDLDGQEQRGVGHKSAELVDDVRDGRGCSAQVEPGPGVECVAPWGRDEDDDEPVGGGCRGSQPVDVVGVPDLDA